MKKFLAILGAAAFALAVAHAPPLKAAPSAGLDNPDAIAAQATLATCEDVNAIRVADGLTFEERAGPGFVPTIQATACPFNFLSAPPVAPPVEPGDDGGG